jgi:hypothetical protein
MKARRIVNRRLECSPVQNVSVFSNHIHTRIHNQKWEKQVFRPYCALICKRVFLTVRLGLVSLYQAPLQARPTKEKHETVKRLNSLLCSLSSLLRLISMFLRFGSCGAFVAAFRVTWILSFSFTTEPTDTERWLPFTIFDGSHRPEGDHIRLKMLLSTKKFGQDRPEGPYNPVKCSSFECPFDRLCTLKVVNSWRLLQNVGCIYVPHPPVSIELKIHRYLP